MEDFLTFLFGIPVFLLYLLVIFGIPIALFRWLWRKGDKK